MEGQLLLDLPFCNFLNNLRQRVFCCENIVRSKGRLKPKHQVSETFFEDSAYSRTKCESGREVSGFDFFQYEA